MANKVVKDRNYVVAKSNEIIQKSRYKLSITQQKLLLFTISKIKPDDFEETEYTFSIKEFCKVIGLNSSEFTYYAYIKQEVKELADSSLWVKMDDGREHLLRWYNKVILEPNSGIITVSFHSEIQPYIFALRTRYTSYPLENVLVFKSKYSIRLYELVKSYCFSLEIGQEKQVDFTIDELKRLMDCESYDWRNFRIKLDKAIDEINQFTPDINITYELERHGRKVEKIIFIVNYPRVVQQVMAKEARRKRLVGHSDNITVKGRDEN